MWKVIKEIKINRGNTIQVKLNNENEYIVTELHNAGYPSEQIMNTVKATSIEQGLERITEVQKIKRDKTWQNMPAWVII